MRYKLWQIDAPLTTDLGKIDWWCKCHFEIKLKYCARFIALEIRIICRGQKRCAYQCIHGICIEFKPNFVHQVLVALSDMNSNCCWIEVNVSGFTSFCDNTKSRIHWKGHELLSFSFLNWSHFEFDWWQSDTYRYTK